MPIFKCVAAFFAMAGSIRLFGVSVRDAKQAAREHGGIGEAAKADSKTFWQDITEVFRGGWK